MPDVEHIHGSTLKVVGRLMSPLHQGARDLEGVPSSMSTIDVRSSRDCRFHSRVSFYSTSLDCLALETHHFRPGRIGRQL